MDTAFRTFSKSLKNVVPDFETHAERSVEHLRALGELAGVLEGFEGQELDMACLLVLLGRKANAGIFKELKTLLEVVVEKLGMVLGLQGKGKALAKDLETFVRDIARVVDRGEWPHSLRAFSFLDGNLSPIHESGDPNRVLSDVPGFPQVLISSSAEALGLGATAATLLSSYSSRFHYSLHGTTVMSLATLSSSCNWSPWGPVLVEAIGGALERGVSFMHPRAPEYLRRTALRVVSIIDIVNTEPSAATVTSLCDVLRHSDLRDANRLESDVIAAALWRVPLESDLWEMLFRRFIDSVRHAHENEGRLRSLLEYVSSHETSARRLDALRLLGRVCDRLVDFVTTDAQELALTVVEWLKTGGEGFSEDELVALTDAAVATCIDVFLGHVSLDEVELRRHSTTFVQNVTDRKMTGGNIWALRVLVDGLHAIHPEQNARHRPSEFAKLLECVKGEAEAKLLCLAPFVFRLNGRDLMSCVKALSNPEVTSRVGGKVALANSLGYVATAFCTSASEDGRFFLRGLAHACLYLKQNSVPLGYQASGKLPLTLSTLDTVCKALLNGNDEAVIKALSASMVPILRTITDEGLQGSAHVLQAIVMEASRMEWCCMKPFLKALFRDSVVEAWSGRQGVAAKRELLRRVWRSHMNREDAVRFYLEFYNDKVCPELSEDVVSYLMLMLRTDASHFAEVALSHIASRENTSLHDIVWKDGGKNFADVFTLHPDVMDKVSDLIRCEASELSKCYVRHGLDLVWEREDEDNGQRILRDLSQRIPATEWRSILVEEFQKSLVPALWRKEEGVWKNFLKIAQELSDMEQGEWQSMLTSSFSRMSTLLIRCAGQECKSKSSEEGASECLSLLRTLAQICKVRKQKAKDFLEDGLLVNKILVPMNTRLSLKVECENKIGALKSLQILPHLLGEAGILLRYSPQLLALVRAGLLSGKEENEACNGVEALKSILKTAVLGVAEDNLNIFQEIVVALAPALSTRNEAHQSACSLLQELISKSSEGTIRRLAALTFGVLHIHHTQSNGDCPILVEMYGDLHAAGFFSTSKDCCPLFEELCESLAGACGHVLMEGVSSMQEFLEENVFWIRRMACGELGVRGLERAKKAVGILGMCLNKTGRSMDGHRTNAKCAKCLGMIGIVNPTSGHPTTFLSLEMPETEEGVVHVLAKHLERILFSGGIHSVEMASRALCGLREGKMLKPGDIKHLSPWLSPSSSKGTDVLLEPVTDEMLSDVGDLSFRRWLYLWLVFLHDKKPRGKLSSTNTKLVVAAMEHDVSSMMFLFPFLMYRAVVGATSADMDVIVKGLLPVFTEANSPVCQRFDTQKCQMVFLLLDCLHGLLPKSMEERRNGAIGKLLARFDGRLLADTAFKCGAYTRALKDLEEHLMEKYEGGPSTHALQSSAFLAEGVQHSAFKPEEVTFLMQIYAQLGEPDGLLGLSHLSAGACHTIALAEENREWDKALFGWQLKLHAVKNQEQDAETLSQRVEPTISDMESKDQVLRGQLRCLLRAGRLPAIKANFAMGTGEECAPWSIEQITALECEALWKMGEWADLDKCLNRLDGKKALGDVEMLLPSPQEEFNLSIGRLLLMLQQRGANLVERFENESQSALMNILRDIPARAAESYTQAGPLIGRLEILEDIKNALELLQNGETGDDTLMQYLKWGRNSHYLDALPESKESRIYFRRQLAAIMQDGAEHRRCSIEVLKMASQAGVDVHTMPWLMNVQIPGSFLEYGKALRRVGRDLELFQLRNELKRVDEAGSSVDGRYKAKVMVELAKRVEDPMVRSQERIALLEKAGALDGTWVKPCLEHARYLDNLYESEISATAGEISEDTAKLLPQILLSYGKAAPLSEKHARDCVSRILTLYFQYGDKVRADPSLRSVERSVHSIMNKIRGEIPLSMWYTSLPNLMARICHSNDSVRVWIVDTMSKVANAYPHQTLWGMAAAINSNRTDRRRAAKEILRRVGSKGQAFVSTFFAFGEELLNLCTAAISKDTKKIDAVQRFNGLYELAGNLGHDVIVPCERYMRGRFPGATWTDPRVTPGGGIPTIVGMKREVIVMNSMLHPRKITLLGSDGEEYPFLAKPKDDLRKDNRLMEFCWSVNEYLQRDGDSRKRELKMRTYMAVPLREESGILEWVDGIATFRELCEELQEQNISLRELKKWNKENPAKWLEMTLSKLKPCFHKWFLRVARRPDEWMSMRVSFTRSAAIWSMVGHMLGLGDRHPENVNIDRATGAIINVDFGCLFDDGVKLPVPEVTPFRLTPNMVDAFGVSGVHGVFINSATIVLKVLRESNRLLLTTIEAFLHDPLVQWVKAGTNVKEILFTVKNRMQGNLLGVKNYSGTIGYKPRTAREQCNFLVWEATNIQNLTRMYFGWMPWI